MRLNNQEQLNIHLFLDSFGRGNRFDIPRASDGSIAQALQLMNSGVVNNRLLHQNNRVFSYLEENLNLTGIIRELFLDFFCREPSAQESQLLLDELANFTSDREKVTTLQWLLLNRVAFTFIY